MARPLAELLHSADPAWQLVLSWIAEAANAVEVLPASDPARADALVATQVTTRSPMGAIVYETGGILIDHGWVRLLGSGHPRLPRTLPAWNVGRSCHTLDGPPFLLVADDAVGGFFAVNGGGLGDDRGNVHYFAPDTLGWDSLGVGYSDFVAWCFSGDLAAFYGEYRRDSWREDVAALAGDRAWAIYPPPVAAGPPFAERHWGDVPVAELYGLYVGNLE